MSDFLIPLYTRVARSTMTYMDSTGVSIGVYTGAVRTASMGGDRLGAQLELSAQKGVDRAVMIGWLMQLRGKQNRAILIDHASELRGVFPSTELIVNGMMAQGVSGWSAGSDYSLSVQDRVLRAYRSAATGAASAVYLNATVATSVGAAYIARFMVHPGKGSYSAGYRIDIGATANSSGIQVGSTLTAFGLETQTFIASGAAASLRLWDLGTGAIGDYLQIPYASIARCILVNGAGQTGSALSVKALPGSTAGLLVAGDLAEVITNKGSELKYTTAPLNSDGSGNGHWQFEPPLRGGPADGAAIIVHQPMGRFVLSGSVPSWINDPGVLSSATFQFEETGN